MLQVESYPTEHECENVFYCDESGNTGVELWSPDQPFYVTGGVLLGATARRRVERYVAALLKEKGWRELKGKSLSRDPVLLMRILDGVRRRGGRFFYAVSEKRLSITMKIVDVLMDPMHNSAAWWLSTGDDVSREQIAALLLELPDATLKMFAEVYKTPSVASWREVAGVLKTQSELMGWPLLVNVFAGAAEAAETIVENEDGSRLRGFEGLGQKVRHHQYASILVPDFCHLVRYVDKWLEDGDAYGQVVHDSLPKFQEIYKWYFGTLRKMNGSSLPVSSGRYRRMGVTRLRRLDFQDSKESFGIQVADILCTGVRLAFCAPDGSDAQKLTLRLLEPMYKREPVAGGVTIAPTTMARMAAARSKMRRLRVRNSSGAKPT
jgi:hypothetical protein